VKVYNLRTDPVVGERPELLDARDVYLAGPFFTPEQEKEIELVERCIERVGLTFFSPRLECRYKRGDEPIVAHRAKALNIYHIQQSLVVVACLSWPDLGTAWELGFAEARNISRLGFSSNRKVGMNLMVRGTVDALVPFDNLPSVLSAVSLDLERGHDHNRTIVAANNDAFWNGEME
jgi:nucleoside 2-deoxyribosyltransferase